MLHLSSAAVLPGHSQTHCSGVKWVSWHLRTIANCLLIHVQLKQYLSITGPLCKESTADQWIQQRANNAESAFKSWHHQSVFKVRLLLCDISIARTIWFAGVSGCWMSSYLSPQPHNSLDPVIPCSQPSNQSLPLCTVARCNIGNLSHSSNS